MNHLIFPDWAVSNKAGSKVESVDNDSARLWMRHVIPMPKLYRLKAGLTLPATGIKLRLRSDASDVEQIAKDELEDLIIEKTGVVNLNGSFQILIGVCTNGKVDGVKVPGADKLNGLKNEDQAYIISPHPSYGLIVAGLTEKGVYYGVKTLQQMIRPGLGNNKIIVPVMVVLDWPDLSERGQWGPWEDNPDQMMKYIHYMAERKMNLMEVNRWNSSLSFDGNNHGVVNLDIVRRIQAHLHAIHTVFITEHVEKLTSTGLFERYPQAKGIGDKAYDRSRKDMVVPCASSPDYVKVLSEWLESCASQGVPDVNMWLPEVAGFKCECDKCKNSNQYVLQTKAFIKAWQIAHEKFPGLRLRILTSQATIDVNDQILALVTRPEIRVTYYSGSLPGTYYPVQEPIIYPLFEDFAKNKGWLGCYPLLSASWKVILPWSCPQYIKYRMTEFVEKGLTSFAGFMAAEYFKDRDVAVNGTNDFDDFNITAAAEWSWNAHGRSEWEFAASWATRCGIKDPETFADWAVMIGPVSWDLYGSLVPHYYFMGTAADMIKNRVKPVLGKGMFRYFPTFQHLTDNLSVSSKALDLAQQLGDKAVIAETRAIQGYLEMIRAIYSMADILAEHKDLNKNQIRSLQVEFIKLQDAEKQTTDALNTWTNTIAPGFEITEGANAAIMTKKTLTDIAASLKSLGIK